ncbi:hypothetical protein V8E55_005054 [Tylopilus felleus]
MGFAKLASLMHLGMSWTIGWSCTSDLQQFLQRSSTVVLIQWYDEHHSHTEVEQNLQNRELVDQRIVLLRDHKNNKDVWEFADIDQAFAGDAFATPKARSQLKTLERSTSLDALAFAVTSCLSSSTRSATFRARQRITTSLNLALANLLLITALTFHLLPPLIIEWRPALASLYFSLSFSQAIPAHETPDGRARCRTVIHLSFNFESDL